MMRPVPAVIVRIMMRIAHHSCETRFWQAWFAAAPNSWPERATVMSVVDCSTASAIVR